MSNGEPDMKKAFKQAIKSNCPDYGKKPTGTKKAKEICPSCIFHYDCARETIRAIEEA